MEKPPCLNSDFKRRLMVAAKVTSGEIPSSGPASTVPRMLLNETWEIGRR